MRNSDLVYTVEEAAKMLGIGVNQAYDAVRRGEIPNIRIGRSIKIPRSAFDKLMLNPPTLNNHVQTAEILKVPPHLERKSRKVSINLRISVELNNKLVKSAIANNVNLNTEITDRLENTFTEANDALNRSPG